MTHPHIKLTGRRLTTPRAAAIAGIMFAVLFSTSVTLIRLSLPEGPFDSMKWLESGARLSRLAIGLMPFAGIAFLWFVGVVRDRLGQFEDQFFSTIFYGSGLLFLAMIFAAAAIVGAIAISYSAGPAEFVNSEVYLFNRAMLSQFFTVYALRMAGVFVISLGTIWLRTGLMPRWLSFITYLFALLLILSTSLNLWMVMVFPGWVLIISIYILVLNMKRHAPGEADGMTLSPLDEN
jgi:hypothetical protein